MNYRLALGAIALAVLTACGGGGGTEPPPVVPPTTIDTARLVVFGDSLSDGGAYSRGNSMILQVNAGVPAQAANLVGKFTNSPGANWTEVLAARLGIAVAPERFEVGAASPVAATNGANVAPNATNYAQGGSRVAKVPGVGCNPNASGVCTAQAAVPVTTQIDRALAKGSFQPTDLVVVWAGANDVFFQTPLTGAAIRAEGTRLGRALTAAETETIVRNTGGGEMVAAGLEVLAQVRRLQAAGAKRIVVMTIPDSADTPAGTAQRATGGQALFAALTKAYNDTLKLEFGKPESGVLLFDAGGLAKAWYDNSASVGIVNKDAPICNVPDSLSNSSSFCFITAAPAGSAQNPFARVLPPGVTADNSMFADGVHPSLKMHGLFGTALYDALKAKSWVR